MRYPTFKPLELGDRPLFIQTLASDPPQISEYTFTNMYSWRERYHFSYAVIDDGIVLKSLDKGRAFFFTPIGTGNRSATLGRIIEETNGTFIRVPETVVSSLDTATLAVQEDPDNFDYVYKTADLVQLAGKKYDGKRNLIKKFKAGYDYTYTPVKPANVSQCLEFEERWCAIKDCDHVEGLNMERQALKDMIANYADFGLIGGAIELKGVIAAVAIAERLNPDTMVMHILKADPAIPGLYQTIMNEFLAREGKNFSYVNMEQDLGVEGLRKAKLSYHPSHMVKKYTIRRA